MAYVERVDKVHDVLVAEWKALDKVSAAAVADTERVDKVFDVVVAGCELLEKVYELGAFHWARPRVGAHVRANRSVRHLISRTYERAAMDRGLR